MSADNKRKLYDALSKDYDMGTFEQFCADIKDEKKRRKLFDAASNDYDFGDFDKFSEQLGFGSGTHLGAPLTEHGTKTEAQQANSLKTQQAASAGTQQSAAVQGEPEEESGDKQKPWQPTPIQKAFLMDQMWQGVEETVDKMHQTVGNATRLAESTGQQGRDRSKLMRQAARQQGIETDPLGINAPLGGSSGGESKPGFIQGAKFYGLTTDKEGNVVPQWQLPDGSLTSSFLDADISEYSARQARFDHEFEKRMKQNGLDPANEDDVAEQRKRDLLDETQRAVDRNLARNEEDIREHYDRENRQYDEQNRWDDNEGFWDNFVRIVGGAANRSVTANAPKSKLSLTDQDKDIRNLVAENQVLTDAKKLLETRSLKQSSGFMGGFWNISNNWRNMKMGARHTLSDIDLYGGGIMALQKAGQLLEIEDKLKQGGSLSDSEINLVYSTMLGQNVAQNVKTPHAYNAAQITVEMFPFMAQMMLNPASGLSRALVTKYGKSGLKKAAMAVVGDVAESAVLVSTLQAPAVAADAIERYLGDVEVGKDIRFKGGHNWAASIAKASGSMLIENYTEMLGTHLGVIKDYIGKGIGKGAGKLFGGKLVGDVSKMINRVRTTDWAKGISNLESRAKWSGTIEEILEEEAGIVLNSITVGDNKISDLWDADQQIDIVLGVGLFGGFVSGIKTVGYPVAKAKAKSDLRSRDGIGGFRFGEDWKGMRLEMENAEDGGLSTVVNDLVRKHARSNEQARAIIDYAYAMMKARGVNIATASKGAEGDVAPEQQDIEESYDHGSDIALSGDSQAMTDVERNYNLTRDRLVASLGEEVVDNIDGDPVGMMSQFASYDESLQVQISDYVNAKAARDGMIQQVRDDIDSQIAMSDAGIDSRVNRQTGMIHAATVNSPEGGRSVCVIDGNIVKTDDGTIDRDKSSKTIIVRDETTNKLEFVDLSQIIDYAEGLDPEQAKEAAREQIRKQVAQEAADKVEGKLSFVPGDSYSILDVNGNEQAISVVGQSIDENGMPVDGFVDIQFADGTKESVAMSYIQECVDMANNARAEQFQADREEEREAQRAAQREADEEAYNTVAPVVAGEWLIGSGENAISSADFLVKALSGLFPMATEAIERIRNEKRGFLNGSIDTLLTNIDAWDEVMSAIKDVILTTYNDREAADILDAILEYPKGAPHRVGQELSARLESLHQRMEINPPTPVDFDINTTVPENVESVPENVESVPENVENGVNSTENSEISTENRSQSPVSEENIQESRIPVDENGEPIYEQATPDDGWDHIMNEAEGDEDIAQAVIATMIKKRANELKDLVKQRDKEIKELKNAPLPENSTVSGNIAAMKERKKAIAEADAKWAALISQAENNLKHWENISSVSTQRKAAAEAERKAQEAAEKEERIAREIAAEEERKKLEAENKAKLSAEKAEKRALAKISKEYVEVYDELKGNREAIERLFQIEPEDIYEVASEVLSRNKILLNTERGSFGARAEVGFGEGERKKLFSMFAPKEKGGKSIAKLAEDEMKQTCDDYGVPYDNMLARDVIIELIHDSEVPSDITHFIVRRRIEQARQIIAAEEAQEREYYEELCWEAYHMTPEEYEAYDDIMSVEADKAFAEFDDYEYNGYIADEIANHKQLEENEHRIHPQSESETESQSYGGRSEGGVESRTDKTERVEADGNRSGIQEENGILSSGEADAMGESASGRGEETTSGNAGDQAVVLSNAPSLGAAISSAEAEVDTDPSEAQKKAGNYRKGHVQVGVFDVTIENPKGSVRRGTDANGKQWESTMTHTYGYIRGTEGVDGDHIDVYISSDVDSWNGRKVFVVDQYNPDGSFDEHKVMLGFNDKEEAFDAYLSNYESGWENGRRLEVTEVNLEDFEKWIDNSKRKTKAFAEYKSVKPTRYNTSSEGGTSSISHADKTAPAISLESRDDVNNKQAERQAIKEGGRILTLSEDNAVANTHDDLSSDGKGNTLSSDKQAEGKAIKKEMQNGKILHLSERLSLDSERYLTEAPSESEGPDLVPTSDNNIVETSKPTDKSTGTDDNPMDNQGNTALPQDSDVSNGKGNTLLSDKQAESKESSEPYTITQTTYTNRKGKTSDVFLVKFNRGLSTEEKGALNAFTRAPLAEGKKTTRGWYDRDQGGYMMRSEEAARQLAEIIGNEAPVSENKESGKTKSWSEMLVYEHLAYTESDPLTEDEIDSSDADDLNKKNARNFLHGNRGMTQLTAYLNIYNNVRNTDRSPSNDFGGEDSAQLDGAGSEKSDGLGERGEGGRDSMPLDRDGGGEAVSGGKTDSKDSEGDSSSSSGKGGDSVVSGKTSGMDGASSGSVRSKGSRDSRSTGSDGDSRRGVSRRSSSKKNGKRTDTSGRNDRSGADEHLDSKEIKDAYNSVIDIFDDIWKAGIDELGLNIMMFNARQLEMMPRLISAVAKLGYLLLKKGITDFNRWLETMHGLIGEQLVKKLGLRESEIDEWITEMWNCDYPIDGKTRTIGEWASELGMETLRRHAETSIEEKRRLQKEAEKIDIEIGNRENITATLPFLLPQQQEDVFKAERQFFDESHNDIDHAYGKGYMFTNGTGTGKTYTGLGIVKRFIRQGKGRVLILTPSQPKVSDWINDASNLGIDLRSLDDWAKAKGTTATTEAGEGAVITTYANFRQNEALLGSEFDLIVYDESHRILENKKGAYTSGMIQHNKLSNKNEQYAFMRLRDIHPVYKEINRRMTEYNERYEKHIADAARRYGTNNVFELRSSGLVAPDFFADWTERQKEKFSDFWKASEEIKNLQNRFREEITPQLEQEAKISAGRTKVVFLSATPFNTRENLDYAEGYIFSYPKDDGSGKSGRSRFYLENFGSGYKWRYHRLENSVANPQALAKQEVAFSDYLQNTLGTMSGRIIDSQFDYSRDFPTVTGEYAPRFNEAMVAFSKSEAMRRAYWSVMGDYIYSSALFESMKVNQILPRIREHLAQGRKVVVYHRRVESKNPLRPPFSYIFETAKLFASEEKDAEKREMYKNEIASMRRKFSDMLQWEKSLDLRMPREQLADAFGKDEVLFFSGKESSKQKNKAVEEFNSDNSGKDIIVIQEASGKEGISLHDRTGDHQRVLITLALPQSPITALQIEGRIYRIGNRSNAIFEYPLLGLDSEMILFGQKFNSQVGTTENLALGSQARDLRESFARGVEENSGEIPLDRQGIGGKEFDSSKRKESDPFEQSVLDYYSNQKLTGRRDNREGKDYFPTPEPLGYMMAQWSRLSEGESVLEPSAGHGAIARYVPESNPLTAIEPSTSLFGKLQIKCGGTGRKFENDVFESYNVINKHDVVLMNPPFGTAGRLAVDHVAKAFSHLEEGGRIVAIIPRGSTDKKFENWINNEKNAVMTGEILLPDITFERAGTSVNCRVVVIDKIGNPALAMQAGTRMARYDLSGRDYGKIEDFFEALRDVEMPERTIDQNARMRKRALAPARELRTIKGVKEVEVTDRFIHVSGRGIWETINWDGMSEAQISALLEREFIDYTRSANRNREWNRADREAVYIELRNLVARLSGKTVDEMERATGAFLSEETAESEERDWNPETVNEPESDYSPMVNDGVYLFSSRVRVVQPSLFDWEGDVEADTSSTISPTQGANLQEEMGEREEKGERGTDGSDIRAEIADAAIDDYCERFSEISRRYDDLVSEIKSRSGKEGEQGALLSELDERRNDELAEAGKRLSAALEEYYLESGQTEEDSRRMARDMAVRVRADLTLQMMEQDPTLAAPLSEHPTRRTPASNVVDSSSQASKTNARSLTAGGELIEFENGGGLRKLDEGEFTLVERRFSESGDFCFMSGKERIESADDVAFIFRSLENYSVEHTFVLLEKEGKPLIVHLGMGDPSSSMADLSAIRGAFDAYGADKIWFIHNHPSGNLMSSHQDRGLLRKIKEMFEPGMVQDGVIIDTTSGRFSTFSENDLTEKRDIPKSGSQQKVKTLNFDRSDFSEGHKRDELFRIKSPEDVASYVSTQRLGRNGKTGYLLMDHSHGIVGNLYSSHTNFGSKKEAKALAEEIARMAIGHGATRVAIYGNMPLKGIQEVKNQLSRITGDKVIILDALKIENGLGASGFESAYNDNLLNEPEIEYGDSENEGDIRYRFDEAADRTFDKTRKDATQRVMDIKKSLLPTSETYFGAILSDDANLPQFFELSTDGGAESLEREGDGPYSDSEVSMENDPWNMEWGESFRAKRSQQESAARVREQMRERAGSLSSMFGIEVEIVDDSSSLTGRKQRAKGWYDTETGKITVVVGNHVSVADMEATMLHEAVAHHGLRELLGEHFNEFLDKVFDVATREIQEKIALLASRNGWDRREATEEYLAGLAESMNFEQVEKDAKGWFGKIKRLFLDMLAKVGFKHLVPGSISDNELRYILWRSYENLAHPERHRSFEWEAEDVAMQDRLGVGEYAKNNKEVTDSSVADAGEITELNEQFNRELEEQMKGNQKPGHVYNMGMPSKELLSTGIVKLPIKLSASVLNRKSTLERHAYNLSAVRDLVKAIQKPWAIFAYGDKKKAQNLIVGIEDNGRQFLVGISINPTVKGTTLEINSIRNVFPKNNHEWINWINEGKLLRVDGKKEIQTIIAKLRMSPVAFDYLDLDDAAKIVENFENPPIPEQNNNNADEETVLFRDGDFTPHDRVMAADYYERMVSRGSFQFREAMQDSMLGLRKLYESIVGSKGFRIEEVAGYENAYLYENRMSSANNAEQHEYFIRYMKPLLSSILTLCGNDKLERRMLTDYMIAKHGLERNAYMRKEAAANKEKTDRDFAGLCGLTGKSNWKDAEDAARQMVDDYESSHDTTELWEKTRLATAATLEKIFLSGLISEKTFNKVSTMYDFYIPLRGWDENTSDEMYGYINGIDNPIAGSVFKKAEGRNSKADDPIATIAKMADDAIRQGNRNIMKQRFLNFVHANPSDLVSVSELWLEYNSVKDVWEPVFANLEPDMTHKKIEEEISKFEERMKTLQQAEPDKYKRGSETTAIPYKVVHGNMKEHQVLVKRNGRTYVLTINGNPRAAQALNGLTNPDNINSGVISELSRLGTTFNRELSALYTTRNPNFIVSNFLRDTVYSNSMIWVKENPRYALRFHKNFGLFNPVVMGGLIAKWENGTLSDSSYVEKMFNEFMLNGGETGYTSVKDIERYKRTIENELKKQGSVGRKAWLSLGMKFEILNRSVENGARFAAFLTSREMGRSLDRSIYDAKEITVNFNKKGSGGKFFGTKGQTFLGNIGALLGWLGRGMFAFFNAGVQGTTNFLRAVRRNPAKSMPGLLTILSLGIGVPLLAVYTGGNGGDDDKNAYYNLPEYIRRSNICFKAGDQWITIPLPIEYRGIYGLGELFFGVACGYENYSDSEFIRQFAAQISQIMPIDMLEGGGGISPFIPTIAKPLTEAYIMNKGWTGLPIYKKETPFNQYDPEWKRVYQNTDPHIVSFTRWLNETTGGGDYEKGTLDLNPAKIEYILKGYLGGLYSFPKQLYNSGEILFGDRAFEWRDIPLANRVLKTGDERTANRKLQREYHKYRVEAEKTEFAFKGYKKDAAKGILEAAERANFIYNSDEFLRYQIFESLNKPLSNLYKMRQKATDEKKKEEYDRMYFRKMRELVDALRDPEKYLEEVGVNVSK